MLRTDRYIMTQFVTGIIPVLLLLLALFSFMALAEELEEVGSGSFTLADALMVVFLTSPKRIVELLPVTTLLGGLIGYGVADLLTGSQVLAATGWLLFGVGGAVGVGIVAALTLRAMNEWREVQHPEADEDAP